MKALFFLTMAATAYAGNDYDSAIAVVHKKAAENRAERLAAYSFSNYDPPSVNTSGDFQTAIAVLYGQHKNLTVTTSRRYHTQ